MCARYCNHMSTSGAVDCEGPLYPSEESLRELGISGPTLLHCCDQDA